MNIRRYESSDCPELAQLFYETVHSVNARDYSPKQLDAWATGSVDLVKWDESLSAHYSIVAIEDDTIVGFGDMDENGYLDRLYVHKDYQHRGIATAICDELEVTIGAAVYVTHASITAKPFFMRRGYNAVREQQVVRHGVSLTNYVMEKPAAT